MERADFVRDAEHDAGAVAARRRAALAAQDQEPRGVGRIVLDISSRMLNPYCSAASAPAMAAAFFLRARKFGRARVGGGFDNFRVRQVLLHPGAALRQRLRMRVKFLDFSRLQLAHQALLDRQNNLRDDFQIAIHKHVERVRHDAFGRILHRNHAVIRAVLAHFGENVRNGFLRGIVQTGAEFRIAA